MSLASLYRSQLKTAQGRVKSARSACDRKRKDVRSTENQLGQLEQRAKQSRSDSQRRSYERQAESKRGQLERARAALNRAEQDLSKTEDKVTEAQQKLQKQEESDQKTAERKAKQDRERRERQERWEKQRQDREAKRLEEERITREASQDQEIEHLHARASELEQRLLEAAQKKAPQEVTVLFLASNPRDEIPLRLDKETREIQKRMRTSDFPESIFIEWRLARQLPDLIQDLNEVRPDVLHFSGHGNDRALVFEDEVENAIPLTNDQVGKLLAAAPKRIRLVLFNSCNSAAQARLATEHAEIAIGMEATVDDRAAQIFAGQFYNSLAFGLSVAQAFEQAVLQVEMEHGSGHEIPTLFHAEGVDPATVVLVNPENQFAETG